MWTAIKQDLSPNLNPLDYAIWGVLENNTNATSHLNIDSLKTAIEEKWNHHHHHVVLLARISLTLSRHFSLSFIASGWSSGLHPVSSHNCCMYVRAGRPAFAWPYAGVYRSTSLMSSSLLLQQCPACLVRPLKLVDKFTYLGSSVSSTEKNIDTRLTKSWTAIDRLSIIWKSGLTDKMKRSFFQAAVVSILLYGCTTWTLTKRPKKKLDGNYTRILRAILNKSWWQHPTRDQLYGHLPPITKTIQVRRTRNGIKCLKNSFWRIANRFEGVLIE